MLRFLVLAALFYVLSPGNFLTLPRNGSKRVVALTHAVVFVVAYYLSEKVAEMLSVKMDEGFGQYDYRFKLNGNQTLRSWFGTASESDKRKKRWNDNADYCQRVTALKDAEYANPTPTMRRGPSRLQQLEAEQKDACDEANEARNKLSDIGISW